VIEEHRVHETDDRAGVLAGHRRERAVDLAPPRQGETDSMGVPGRIIILGVAPSVPESPRRIDRV